MEFVLTRHAQPVSNSSMIGAEGAGRRAWKDLSVLRSLRHLSFAVLLVGLVGCTGSASEPTSAPTSAAPSLSADPGSPSAAPASPTASIVYVGGKVSGVQGRVKVALGSTVTLRVSSDVADEVHLHGYDKRVDVAAGGSAQLSFVASIPGVFALELERSGVELTKIQVQ